MKRIIFAVDPGSGSSSALGICIYDPNKGEILYTTELWPKANNQKPTWRRLLDMMYQIKSHIESARKKYGPLEVRTECFVMRGKGGETLARLVGGLIANLSWDCTFVEVHNIKLKCFITGRHKATKPEMGQGLISKLKNLPSIDAVQKLIDNNNWDAVDAACIAIYHTGEDEEGWS